MGMVTRCSINRVRSLVDTMLLSHAAASRLETRLTPPVYEDKHRNRKILIPFFTPFISPLIPAIMKPLGYDVECLPVSDEKSAEYGLKYANNEVCYPATLVVGDFVKAFREGGYDPSECAVAMTQTGGQCRAINYLPMIKKALIDAGYTDTPVISVAFGSGLENEQPGFKVNWLKVIPFALYSLLFSDSIAKMYYACAAREKVAGTALMLKDKYLAAGAALLEKGKWKELLEVLGKAAEFNDATVDKDTEKIGAVADAYLAILKENPQLPMFLMKEAMRDFDGFVQMALGINVAQAGNNVFSAIESEMEAGTIRKVPFIEIFYTFYGLISVPFLTMPVASQIFGEKQITQQLNENWRNHVVRHMMLLLEPTI